MATNTRKYDCFSPAWLHKGSDGTEVQKNGWLEGSAGGSSANFQPLLTNGSVIGERRSHFGRWTSEQDTSFVSNANSFSPHRPSRPPGYSRPPLVKSHSEDPEQAHSRVSRSRANESGSHWGNRADRSHHSHPGTSALTEKSFNQHFPTLRSGGPVHSEPPPPPPLIGPAGAWDQSFRRPAYGRSVVGQVSRTRRRPPHEGATRSLDSSPTGCDVGGDLTSGHGSEVMAKKSHESSPVLMWNGTGSSANRPRKLLLEKQSPPTSPTLVSPASIEKSTSMSFRSGKQAQSPSGKITLRPLVKPEMRRSPSLSNAREESSSSSLQSITPVWSNQQAPPPAIVRSTTPSKERSTVFVYLKQGEMRTKATTMSSRSDFFKSLRHSCSGENQAVDTAATIVTDDSTSPVDMVVTDESTSPSSPFVTPASEETLCDNTLSSEKGEMMSVNNLLSSSKPINGESDDLSNLSMDPEEFRVLTSMGWHGDNNDDDELSKPITDMEIEEFQKKKQTCQIQNHRNVYNVWKLSYRQPLVFSAESDGSSDLSDSSDDEM